VTANLQKYLTDTQVYQDVRSLTTALTKP